MKRAAGHEGAPTRITSTRSASILREAAASFRAAAVTMAFCCAAYAAVVLAFAQLAAPWRAEGSLVRNGDGTFAGSALIAQRFTRPEYFHPRPSAVDYDASAAGGSNLSPANPALRERVLADIVRLRSGDSDLAIAAVAVPPDLVTASGSGLDPHITMAAARFQAARVARARVLSPSMVLHMLHEAAWVNPAGDTLVNVLRVNMALDGKDGGNAW